MTVTEFGTRGPITRNTNRRDLASAQAEAAEYGLDVVVRVDGGPWETWAGDLAEVAR